MKSQILFATCLALASVCASSAARAQLSGEPYIHDPSTVIESDGKYFTFGTGAGGLMSDDGWTWHTGAVRPGGGVAPDVIKIGNRYLMSYATGRGGHASDIITMWNKTLDPKSPDFKFYDSSVVASSDGVEDCDAIDPAFLYAEGHLWLSYGTYFGYIRIVELDPKTGKRVAGNKPVNAAIDMEATDLMYRDGWYYLLGTHGTCCDGANSTYNIRVGRSRKPTGPYVDNMGIELLKGGGKLVAAASNRHFGIGHFGQLDLGDEVQKFSMHYEADMDRGGRSVLAIRPLLWKNGWPVGGDDFEPGTYEIQSERSGFALELAVDYVRINNGRGGFGGPPPSAPGANATGQQAPHPPAAAPAQGGQAPHPPMGSPWGAPTGPVTPVPDQTLEQDSANWPAGTIDIRLNDYMMRPHQKWTITALTDAGGYPGAPYYKITLAGTTRALAATAEGDLVAVAAFTGAPEQLWRIDQLTDGTYRIMPKAMPDSKEPVALTAVGASSVTLAKFDAKSDKSRWNFRKP
jgi:arabinan endo-1,5-alpha-L-arabinosidase